jgi:formylmethanofuran dehydrogenase subunit B
MAEAWIDGRPAALEVAAGEAARLLSASRLAVIAGLGADVAGARAALALAGRLHGVVDHMHADALLHVFDVIRESGMLITTPAEAAVRADTILLVGSGLSVAWPDLGRRLLSRAPDPKFAESRKIYWLCAGSDRLKLGSGGPHIEAVGRDVEQLPTLLAALRTRLAGRPCGNSPLSGKALDRLVASLSAARFGVAVWSAAELDVLSTEMLCGIVKDLNASTRFSGLPLMPGDNAWGVTQVCGWMSGFPMRTGFGRGYPEHDPWRFEARRLVESGEADCVLWISAYRPAAPGWNADVPVIALTATGASFSRTPKVLIPVGRPGVDHDAVERLPETGTIGHVKASQRSDAVSVAQAICHIAAALPPDGVSPC